MEIKRGLPARKGIKCLVYGPEGIGKTTFASRFPAPVFIDTEGSTRWIDVARYDAPLSWQMLLDEVADVKRHPEYQTLVIDTADWAERMCARNICDKAKKGGIEDFGYGKGYVYVAEDFGKLLNALTELSDAGIHICVTAHAYCRKFELPEEMGSYDRYELKMDKRVSAMLKEWCDMVLFANYKTIIITDENKKRHAQGSSRVMYATHHACWDAKNRAGLPDELPFEFSAIAHLFEDSAGLPEGCAPIHPVPVPEPMPARRAETPSDAARPTDGQCAAETRTRDTAPQSAATAYDIPDCVPAELKQLMRENGVILEEIIYAVAQRGFYPADTPFEKYDPEFIKGCLIGAWPQVLALILSNRTDTPF